MQILKAAIHDIPQVKQLWNICFEKENIPFTDFALSDADIYIVKENGTVVSALAALSELEFSASKGCYLYNLCTHPDYRGKGYMTALVNYAAEDRKNSGYSFCAVKYTGEKMQALLQSAGFDNTVYLRRFETEIKRNIWQNADFDIITASRFRPSREKFCNENILHYTGAGYGHYTAFMYTSGGSTAENDGAYAVYFAENGRLEIKEIFALSTLHATKLLQAVRERTGIETAVVYLPENSTLFLGEGVKVPVYLTRGLTDDVCANLMP